MEIIEAIRNRHSVRHYNEKDIEPEKNDKLNELINQYNTESDLHIQLITNEPRSFGESIMARYGKFSGVKNYFAMIGKRGEQLDPLVGYYGEKLVLEAQMMGLNTCWVGLSYKKISNVLNIANNEKLVCVIAVGYGANQGVAHNSKSPNKVSTTDVRQAPIWYQRGITSALLAPTAINQQKFRFTLHEDNKVSVKAGIGFYSKVDLGIVKYHFEVGAGVENFEWILYQP